MEEEEPVSQPNSEEEWRDRFRIRFEENERADGEEHEDMLFYVPKGEAVVSGDAPYGVHRRGSTPLHVRAGVAWRESFYLNALVNALRYTLLVEVYHRDETGSASKRLLHRVSKRVFASPSRHAMDEDKAAELVHTYPHIFFAVHDFHEGVDELVVSAERNLVAVRLIVDGGTLVRSGSGVPRGPRGRPPCIFSGALSYGAIRTAYGQELDRTTAVASASSSPLWALPQQWLKGRASSAEEPALAATAVPKSFINLKGPGGVGDAQLAIVPVLPSASPSPAAPQSSWGSSLWRGLTGTPATPPSDAACRAAQSFQVSITFISVSWTDIVEKVEPSSSSSSST